MSHDETHRTDRRRFLQAGAAATAAAASLAPGAIAQEAPAKPDATAVLPKRKLGKTGVEVTLLEQGGVRNDTDRDPAVLLRPRHPPLRHRQGLRDRARLQEVVRHRFEPSASRSSWSPRTCPVSRPTC